MAEKKRRMRAEVLARRDALPPDERAARSQEVCRRLLPLAEAHRRRMPLAEACGDRPRVAAFLPMGSEVDLRPFMRACAQRGWPVCLPVTVRDEAGLGLVFAQVAPSAILTGNVPDLFLHPMRSLRRDDGRLASAHVVPPGSLDLMVVPLVAFDAQGGRLGYGGGCYDRTLPQLAPDARAVGAAFREQQVGAVPREAHDRPLAQVIAG